MAFDSGRLTVAILFGGRSSEHSISCLSAANVLANADRDRYRVLAIGIGRDGSWCSVDPAELIANAESGGLPEVSGVAASPLDLLTGVDVVFPLLHGRFGEDGTIQGLLEIVGKRFVGSGVLASALAMDKAVTKRLLRDAGLPVGEFVDVRIDRWDHDAERIGREVARLNWPVFVKPARAGSSIGISRVTEPRRLGEAMRVAFAHDRKVIVEAAVPDAREVEVGVVSSSTGGSPQISVPAEIIVDPSHEFYDFEAKYVDGSSEVVVPADLSAGQIARLGDLAVRAFEAVGCVGLARVDFFVRLDGSVVLNELNTMPGFTTSSAFPRMWAHSGLTLPSLIGRLVDGLIEGPSDHPAV